MMEFIISLTIALGYSPDINGKASYYGKGNWHGTITANGEKFEPYAHICAHRTLPFGTKLAIINKENNKKALCRINDRGPFDIKDGKPIVDLDSKYERVLDVSVGVAKELNMIDSGIVNVDIYIIKKP